MVIFSHTEPYKISSALPQASGDPGYNQGDQMNIPAKKIKQAGISDFKKYINMTQGVFLSSVGLDLIEGQRQGVYSWDIGTDEQYIDCFCSAGSFNVGRRNPQIVRALEEALADWSMGDYLFPSGPKVALAEKLVSITPSGLDSVLLCVGGGEAIDSSLKMARGTTGRKKVISLAKAYHGHTGFALSAIGKPVYRDPFEPLIPGFSFEPAVNDLEAVSRLADEETAAIIIEPVQGEGGIYVASQEFVEGLRRLCDERGILLIFDEVQTGFGRTGKMFCCEHYGVTPDLMVLAKSLGGTLYPMAAVIYNDRVRSFMEENPAIIESTSGGADLGCIVGCAVIDFLLENKIPEHAAKMGDYIGDAVLNLAKKHQGLVKEVRRKGLMMGLEYTHDMMGPLMSFFLQTNGVMAVFSANNPKVMRFMPPLVIEKDEADRLIDALDQAMAAVKRSSNMINRASKLPLIGRALGVQEMQVFVIIIAKALGKIVPKKNRRQK
jgi:putrescine aminotransferase